MKTIPIKTLKITTQNKPTKMKSKKKQNNLSFRPPSYTSISLKKKPRKTISTSPPKTFSPNLRKLSYSQAKSKKPNLPPYGDADQDHVLNKFDCRPFDYYKHKVPEKMKNYPVYSVKRGKETASDVFFRLETRFPQAYKEGGSIEKKYSDLTAKHLKQRRQRQQQPSKDSPFIKSTTPELKGKKTVAPKSHFDIVGIYPNLELKFTTQEALMVYKYIIRYLKKEHPSKHFVADPTNAKMFGKLKVYDYDPKKEYEKLKSKYIANKFKQAAKKYNNKIPNEIKRELPKLSQEEQAYIQEQMSYDPSSVEPEEKKMKTLLKKAPQHIKSLLTLLNQKPIVTIMISDDPADVILQASQLKKSAEKKATFSDIKSDTGYAGKVLTAPSCQRLGGQFETGSFSAVSWHNAVAYIYTGNKKPDKDKWDGRLSIRWGLTDNNKVEVALEDCVYPWSRAGEEHGSAAANRIYSQAIKHALHKVLAKKGYTQEDVNIKLPRGVGYSDVAREKDVDFYYQSEPDKVSGKQIKVATFPTEYYNEPDLSSLSIDKVDPAKYTKVKKGSIPKPLAQFLLSKPGIHKKSARKLRGKGVKTLFTPAEEIMKKGSLDEGTLFANIKQYAPSIAQRETLPKEGTVFNYFATGKVSDTKARQSFLQHQKLEQKHLGPFFEKSEESHKSTEIGTLMQRKYTQKQPYQLFALGEVPESAQHIAKSEKVSAPVLSKIAFAPKGKMINAKKELLYRENLAPRFVRAMLKDPELHVHILEKQDTKLTNADFEKMFKKATNDIKHFLIKHYPEHLKTTTITSYITSPSSHGKDKDKLIIDYILLLEPVYKSFDIILACAKTGLSDDASNRDWMSFVVPTLARAKQFYQEEGHLAPYRIIEQLIRTSPRYVINSANLLSEILSTSAETTSADQLDDIITKLMKKVDKIRLQQKLQDNYYPIKERAKQSTIDKIEKFLKTEYTPKKQLDASTFKIDQPVRIKSNYDFTPDEKAGFVGPGVSPEVKRRAGQKAKITNINPTGEITLSPRFHKEEFPVKPQWIKPLTTKESILQGRVKVDPKKRKKYYDKYAKAIPYLKDHWEDKVLDYTFKVNEIMEIEGYDIADVIRIGTGGHWKIPVEFLTPESEMKQSSSDLTPQTQEIKEGDTVEIIDMHSEDAYHSQKDDFIGRTGKVDSIFKCTINNLAEKGYYGGRLIIGNEHHSFAAIKLRKVYSFSLGQQVKIRQPTEPRQQEPSRDYPEFAPWWNSSMDETIGRTGTVSLIGEGGRKTVDFPNIVGGRNQWAYRPADLEPVNLTPTTQQQSSRFNQSNVQEDNIVQIKAFTGEEEDRLYEEYAMTPGVSLEISSSRMIVKETQRTVFKAEKISNEEETDWWLPYWAISLVLTRAEDQTTNQQSQQSIPSDDPSIQGTSHYRLSDFSEGETIVVRNTGGTRYNTAGKIATIDNITDTLIGVTINGRTYGFLPSQISKYDSGTQQSQETISDERTLRAEITQAIENNNSSQALDVLKRCSGIDIDVYIRQMQRLLHTGFTSDSDIKIHLLNIIENISYQGGKVLSEYINFIIEYLIRNTHIAGYYASGAYDHSKYRHYAIKEILLKVAEYYYNTDHAKLFQMIRNTSLPADIREEISRQFTDQEDQTIGQQLRNTDVSTSTFNNLIRQYNDEHDIEDTLDLIYDTATEQGNKVHPGVYDLVREEAEGNEQAIPHFLNERYWAEIVSVYGEDEAKEIIKACAGQLHRYGEQEPIDLLQLIINDDDFPQELRNELREMYADDIE